MYGITGCDKCIGKLYNGKYGKPGTRRLSDDPIVKKMTAAVRGSITRGMSIIRAGGLPIERRSVEMITGLTIKELKSYIESKFKEGMSWNNYGYWQVDHIYPISKAKSVRDVFRLSHHTNLQPLWREENLEKSDKVGVGYSNTSDSHIEDITDREEIRRLIIKYRWNMFYNDIRTNKIVYGDKHYTYKNN